MTDPRIARFGAFECRYRDGQLEWRVPGRDWHMDPRKPEDYAAVADLVKHPTRPARPRVRGQGRAE